MHLSPFFAAADLRENAAQRFPRLNAAASKR